MNMIPSLEQEIGGVMLKPDTRDRGLEENIIQDINLAGYQTVFQTEVMLDADDVEWIYPDLCKINGVRDRLVGYLAGQQVSLIGFRKISEEIDNPTQHLHALKGDKIAGTGIRGKYRDGVLNSEDLKNKTKKYYFYTMINNIHVFDSAELFIDFLQRKGIDMSQLLIYLEQESNI